MTRTYKECCKEVAIKHGVGKEGLVTGHLPKYFEEAAELFAQQFRSQPETESKSADKILRQYGQQVTTPEGVFIGLVGKEAIKALEEYAALRSQPEKQSIPEGDEYAELKKKAEQWDKLGEKIAAHYEEGSGSDITTIGEEAAIAYGFL